MGLTTDRTDDCISILRPDGQQECYLILPQGERDKGYVRPVRRSYIHVACGAVTTMAQAIAETYARDPGFYSGTFCVNCREHFDLCSPRKAGKHGLVTENVVWHFKWLDSKDGEWDGSFVGQ